MTKLLDMCSVHATEWTFSAENFSAGRLNPLLILELSNDEVVSMAIENNGDDDESRDLADALKSLNSPGQSISLEEFRRRHGLR